VAAEGLAVEAKKVAASIYEIDRFMLDPGRRHQRNETLMGILRAMRSKATTRAGVWW
jgi:hypothetical protein